MDRQVRAVAEAIKFAKWQTSEEKAVAAIAASDASLVPGLVSALQFYADKKHFEGHGEGYVENGLLAKKALASLPAEYRNVKGQGDE